ncbi:TRAP transporter large permease [Brevibacillus marinus]|uniref:TRAP transporter large permease n=1 Tax=Brevibacillus marinus TaxID=2496837 RepID=UPI000F8267E8|nr:TRAP transporter large permease [Brevibacillus marinus]
MTVLVLFGSLFLLLFLSVPIGFALGLSTLITMTFTTDLNIAVIAQKAFTALDSFPLMAIPFFTLAGLLMGTGGVSKRLLDLATVLVGWMQGGLAMVTILGCMFFAAISGSGPATVAAMGSIMIPAMKERNYGAGFASAITAASGSIGVIIPPSIPFVMFGIIAGVSVGDLFIGGIIPGILIGVGLMITSYFIAKKNNYAPASNERITFKHVVKAINEAKWGLLIPIIILGGIYGGIFSPTEAAVVAAVYGLIIGMFVYRELTWKDVYDCFKNTVIIGATTNVIVGLSISFAYLMTLEQVPTTIAEFIGSLSDSKFVILMAINLFLLIVGMFIDTISAIVVLAPILLPVATSFGVDPIHFGVIMVTNLAIGFVTPPLGVNLIVASSIGKISFERISAAVVPFIITMVVTLLVITYVPELSIWLPTVLKD